MNARETFDKLIYLMASSKYMQGYYRQDANVEIAMLADELRSILDEYDKMELVPLCPDREDPHHWASNCYMCDNEGLAFIKPKEVRQVKVEVEYQGKAKPFIQLEMFEDKT